MAWLHPKATVSRQGTESCIPDKIISTCGLTPESLARNWARFMNWVLAVDGSGFIFWKHCVGLVVERRECLGLKETAAMVFLS